MAQKPQVPAKPGFGLSSGEVSEAGSRTGSIASIGPKKIQEGRKQNDAPRENTSRYFWPVMQALLNQPLEPSSAISSPRLLSGRVTKTKWILTTEITVEIMGIKSSKRLRKTIILNRSKNLGF